MAYRLPPLAALRAFESAARHGSFKEAATELSVTPAAISQQIKLLEEYLDAPLFHRQSRGIQPTDTALAMLPKLREGFECLAAAVEATRAETGCGPLTVTAPPSFAVRWLVPHLNSFQKAHPDCALSIASSLNTVDRRSGVAAQGSEEVDPRSGETHISIRFGHGRYPGYVVTRIFAPDYAPACSPRLPVPGKPLKVPDDVRRYPLIHDETVPDLEDRPGWESWLRLAEVSGVDTRRGPRFNSQALAIEAAIAGQGLVLVPKPLISADVHAGRLIVPFDLEIPSRYAYYLVTPQAVSTRPAVRAFHDWLIHEVANDPVISRPRKD
jgi:LysR family glycine cleavage system transcriptional activator